MSTDSEYMPGSDKMKIDKFYSHPKVKKARELLKEAELEIIAEKKNIINKEICICGHIRKEHGEPHNINYTGGICGKCKCMNFLRKQDYPTGNCRGRVE